jgi:hypothetical protein
VPYLPRLRALALFGRRPSERGDSLGMPASENLHNTGNTDNARRSENELGAAHAVLSSRRFIHSRQDGGKSRL